jgi:hypothetical protein
MFGPLTANPSKVLCFFIIIYYYFIWGSDSHSYCRNSQADRYLGGGGKDVLRWSSGQLQKMGVGTPIFGSQLTKTLQKNWYFYYNVKTIYTVYHFVVFHNEKWKYQGMNLNYLQNYFYIGNPK